MTDPPLGFLLSHLGDVLRTTTGKALTDLGLTPREYGVLWRLDAHGPLSQRELGALHRIDRTTVVALVDRLEEMGLVVRRVDPHDRRRHALDLTDAGHRRLDEARAAVDGVEATFLASLDPTRRRDLVATLRLLLDDDGGDR